MIPSGPSTGIPPSIPSPQTHWGYTAGALYTDAQSLAAMLRCIRHGGQTEQGSWIDADLIRAMKQPHSSYGRRSPTLRYGLGLLIVDDPRLCGETLYGHQGFAYGSVNGAFITESDHLCTVFLTGGCSEARSGMLGLCNRDILAWAEKEIHQWSS